MNVSGNGFKCIGSGRCWTLRATDDGVPGEHKAHDEESEARNNSRHPGRRTGTNAEDGNAGRPASGTGVGAATGYGVRGSRVGLRGTGMSEVQELQRQAASVGA